MLFVLCRGRLKPSAQRLSSRSNRHNEEIRKPCLAHTPCLPVSRSCGYSEQGQSRTCYRSPNAFEGYSCANFRNHRACVASKQVVAPTTTKQNYMHTLLTNYYPHACMNMYMPADSFVIEAAQYAMRHCVREPPLWPRAMRAMRKCGTARCALALLSPSLVHNHRRLCCSTRRPFSCVQQTALLLSKLKLTFVVPLFKQTETSPPPSSGRVSFADINIF